MSKQSRHFLKGSSTKRLEFTETQKYEQHKRHSLGLELCSTMVISYDNVSLKQHVTNARVF